MLVENVGRGDQIIRSIVGPALIIFGYAQLGGRHGRLGGLAAIVTGALLTESVLTRYCPVYPLIGADTRSSSLRLRDARSS